MTQILESNKNTYVLTKLLGKGYSCQCFQGYKISEPSTLYAIKIYEKEKEESYKAEYNFHQKLEGIKSFTRIFNNGEGFLYPSVELQENLITSEKSKEKQINEIQKLPVYFLVEELGTNGTLFDYIQAGGSKNLPEKIAANIFIKLVKEVKLIHSKNIIHCDIKPDNVILDNNLYPKLIDFGYSQKISNDKATLHNGQGSEIYSSYESSHKRKTGFNGKSSDVFSLGVCLFVMTVGYFPFSAISKKNKSYYFIYKEKYEKFWEIFESVELSQEFKDLINQLICHCPEKRLSLDKILENEWIKKNVEKEFITRDEEEVLKDEFKFNYSKSYGNEFVIGELLRRKKFL